MRISGKERRNNDKRKGHRRAMAFFVIGNFVISYHKKRSAMDAHAFAVEGVA
jgi:hypothetical protein